MTDTREALFADPLTNAGLFAFDDGVERTFPDMIKPSVPGYTTIACMPGMLAGIFTTPASALPPLASAAVTSGSSVATSPRLLR